MSPPEVLLWSQLRASKLGFKVRRQHPIGPYVADFYAREGKLVVEVDGEVHDYGSNPVRDLARDRYLAEQNYRVLRLSGRDVMGNLDGAVRLICALVADPSTMLRMVPLPVPGRSSFD